VAIGRIRSIRALSAFGQQDAREIVSPRAAEARRSELVGSLVPARQNAPPDGPVAFIPYNVAALGLETEGATFAKLEAAMKFIEMTGKSLKRLIAEDELHAGDLESEGVHDDTIVRINRQGDIEIRRIDRWDVIGGLLGNYEQRLQHETGLEWAE
jgi:hypothetical protein